MVNRYYITTPIYYVNASPHIGHSYTTTAADTLARFMRQRLGRENVWFLTGTDEHGQKIQRAAQELGISAEDFVDRMSQEFRQLWERLSISYNDFIRTTEPRHISCVQRVLELLHAKSEIYLAQYSGWYCTPCETFWTESQITSQGCPECGRPVEMISETNYFLRLKEHQKWLIEYIENHPDFVKPDFRRNEVLSFLKMNELSDLCISRPKERLEWGIPIPFASGHVTYVWFDALINYISAVGFFDKNNRYVSNWWQSDTVLVHLVGKDILRQHAIYWPIILHALDIELPEKMTIFAHGWWLMHQAKMSKSRGNVVAPLEMVERFGVDTYRYFLLRDVPFGLDGNFSEDSIIKRHNDDLANDLGNLVQRTLTMVEKYFGGVIPSVEIGNFKYDSNGELIKSKLGESLKGILDRHLGFDSDFNFSSALQDIWEVINLANKYIEEVKPWNLARENKIKELGFFIRLLVELILQVADCISPFMPATSDCIIQQFSQATVKKGSPLFPRLERR